MENPILLSLASEIIEIPGALQGQRRLSGKCRHNLFTLTAKREDPPPQPEIEEALDRTNTFQRHSHRKARGRHGNLALRRILNLGDLGREIIRQQISIPRNALETLPSDPQIRRDEVEIETFGQGRGKTHEKLSRVGDPGQLTARASKQ